MKKLAADKPIRIRAKRQHPFLQKPVWAARFGRWQWPLGKTPLIESGERKGEHSGKRPGNIFFVMCLYDVICSYIGASELPDQAEVTYQTLADDLDVEPRYVASGVRTLEQMELIEVEYGKGSKGHKAETNKYMAINDVPPQWIADTIQDQPYLLQRIVYQPPAESVVEPPTADRNHSSTLDVDRNHSSTLLPDRNHSSTLTSPRQEPQFHTTNQPDRNHSSTLNGVSVEPQDEPDRNHSSYKIYRDIDDQNMAAAAAASDDQDSISQEREPTSEPDKLADTNISRASHILYPATVGQHRSQPPGRQPPLPPELWQLYAGADGLLQRPTKVQVDEVRQLTEGVPQACVAAALRRAGLCKTDTSASPHGLFRKILREDHTSQGCTGQHEEQSNDQPRRSNRPVSAAERSEQIAERARQLYAGLGKRG